jgi:hypothetical protein
MGPQGVARKYKNTITNVDTRPSVSTGNIAAGTKVNATITGFKSYVLFGIETSSKSWVRIYTDATSRTNDASRTVTTEPTLGSGLITEIVTTGSGSTTQLITPAVFGFNNDVPPTTTLYLAITNLDSVTKNITVYLTLLQMEA